MRHMIGQTLGRYKLVSLLAEGGMGAVFKGHDPTLQRDVAIKVMHSQYARSPDFRDRFLREGRAAARLNHPGIVMVFDSGQERDTFYIVMEFIPGDNLEKILRDLRNNDVWVLLSETIELMRQICQAVHYVHHQGVLHRDIKPANIMLKAEPTDKLSYRPVITDLGLAKLVGEETITQTGALMGTYAYMSPEQASGKVTDARSDVYSLGIILYELAVGRLPFRITNAFEAIHCHTEEIPPQPRKLKPDLPRIVEIAILKALEKEPAKRFPDAEALAEALGYIWTKVSTETIPPTALARAVSLITQLEPSLVEARGPSVLDEFPETPADLSQDRIVVRDQDKRLHSVQMKAKGLTIGREADNDLVLDESRVSRYHARVEFDGINYKVVDLGSANGTFLAKGTPTPAAWTKLTPNEPEAWTPDDVLRIGESYLWLQQSQQQPVKSSIIREDGTMVDSSLIRTSPDDGRVAIFMEPAELSVEPGQSTTASLIIRNQGSKVDNFPILVSGVPSDWVSVSPPAIESLPPAVQQEVTLVIQPPRSPQSRAGRHPLTVCVGSEDEPAQFVEEKKTLTVAEYYQFSSELQTHKVQAGQAGRVTVRNQGNTPQTFTLTWQDQANDLDFKPSNTELTVPPGQEKTAQFRPTPRHRPWVGGSRIHPFTAQVSPVSGETQSHSGEVVSKGRIPVWVLPILGLICLLCATPGLIPFIWPTPTPEPPTKAPTETPTETPAVLVKTWADRSTIYQGECTVLYWDIQNAQKVYLEGKDVPPEGQQEVCPAMTTTYTWYIDSSDGSDLERDQTIEVIPATEQPPETQETPTEEPLDEEHPTEELLCTVVSEGLNLRNGPGAVYDSIAVLAEGTTLEPYKRIGYPEGRSWILVRVQGTGQEGWVSAKEDYVYCNFDESGLPLGEAPPTPTPLADTSTPTPNPPDLSRIKYIDKNFTVTSKKYHEYALRFIAPNCEELINDNWWGLEYQVRVDDGAWETIIGVDNTRDIHCVTQADRYPGSRYEDFEINTGVKWVQICGKAKCGYGSRIEWKIRPFPCYKDGKDECD